MKAEIKRLQDMPVSRADFSLILKEHIKAQAEQSAGRLVSTLTDAKPTFDGKGLEYGRYNRRPLKRLESSFTGWLFSSVETDCDFLSHSQLENGAGGIRSLLCFLFPDIIHDRIMQTVEEEIGEKWGNDDLLSVSERRGKIIDMQNEIKDLEGISRIGRGNQRIWCANGLTGEKSRAIMRLSSSIGRTAVRS